MAFDVLWKPGLSTTAVDGRGTPLLSERVCSCVCLGFERTCEANPAGENSSFIFTVCVKSVSLCHFKHAYDSCLCSSTYSCQRFVLKPISKNGEICHFKFWSHFWQTLKISCSVLPNSYPKLYITAENMSCIHIKQQMLRMNENSACTFHFRWNA